MTIPKPIDQLTPEELRVECAEAMGWKDVSPRYASEYAPTFALALCRAYIAVVRAGKEQAGEVKEEREELGEAWEQLAHNFPAIQVDCENTIQAAQFVNSEWERSQSELTQLRQDAKRLREASQAVVDRWETPLWKDVPHTATFIHALRDALSAMQPSPRGHFAHPFRTLLGTIQCRVE